MSVTVTVGGTTLETILNVSESDRTDSDLGSCRILCRDTSANRNAAEAGADIVISRDGKTTFRGYVTRERPQSSQLLIEGIENRLELKHEQVSRVFYATSRSDAIKSAVTKKARPLGRTIVHTGDERSQWQSTAPTAELYDGTRAGLYKWGTDLIFAGARSGFDRDTIQTTFTNVDSDAIRDGILELRTRLIINDPGGVFDLEVELVTPSGTAYVWEPELQVGAHEYRLPAEEASQDGKASGNGVLQYRLIPNGELSQNVGMFIDSAHTFPFILDSRDTNIGTSGVEGSNGSITRSVDKPVAPFIQDLVTELKGQWWIEGTTLNTRIGRTDTASLEIDPDKTTIVDVDTDQDYESIRNSVTVEYGDGQTVEVDEPASIGFYGPAPREEPLQPGIEYREEAVKHGRGFLADRAWDDALATISIADMDYANLRSDQRIRVNLPSENLQGTYSISEVEAERTATGVVDVTITATSG